MLDVTDLAPGTRLRLAGGLLAEVVENLGNGEWLRVRLPERPDAAEELCHATDIERVL
ncbi:MAG: hypothetical protein KGI51_06515 [Rhodospirillales bacterium]|nr:hypothetical protein [Rhodospirillales bacterium]